MHLPVVVFPQPLSPTSPSVSPFLILNETLSTAFITAIFYCNIIPEVTGKYISKLFTSIRFSVVFV
jgi:hypothetical protein